MLDPTDRSDSPTSPSPSPSPQRPRIALAHDWLVARRGGELVLDAIATHLLNRNLTLTRCYTMFRSGRPITPAIDALPVTTATLNLLPSPLRRWLLPAYPQAVAELSKRLAHDHQRAPIDLLISTSSSAIKGLAPPPAVPHLCYCHTPARYLWARRDDYTVGHSLKDRLRAAGLAHFGDALRDWDKHTASNVTRFIANSTHIAGQIRAVYDRDAVVIHPPVRTDLFTPDPSVERTDRALVVSALEPYKRVDLAIRACARANIPLDIVGTGSALRALKDLARPHPNIAFHHHADDHTLLNLMRRARVLLHPQIEDFGITALEAQSCNTPVVARRAGGALDTVIDTKTGSFFDDPTEDGLIRAIERAPAPNTHCRTNALRFSAAAFNAKLDAVIDAALS
jgi:glycosyltransferase involved in cell wall biosynthesis